jgi:dolichol kinase
MSWFPDCVLSNRSRINWENILIGKLQSLSASYMCVCLCVCVCVCERERERDHMISGLYMFFTVITIFILYCYDMKF